MTSRMPLRKARVLVRTMEDECLLYDEERGRIHVVNAVAGAVWAMCDGRHTIPDIAAGVRQAYDTPHEANVTGDVESIVSRFADLGLLEPQGESQPA